jgi:serine/threonine-protein phosphatase 2A activator
VKEFVGFISALNDAVKGKKVSDSCEVSQPVQTMLDILQKLGEWVDEIPPAQQALRYGNPAFRSAVSSLHQALLLGLEHCLF